MTDIAQMRFRSVARPDECGIVVLSDDGMVRVVPSEEFRDAMAKIEEAAVRRSRKVGAATGLTLLALGAGALALSWLLGRVFGRLRSSLGEPRPIEDVRMTRDRAGRVTLRLRGQESRWQIVTMNWNPDEVLQPEAEKLYQLLSDARAGRPYAPETGA